MLVSCQHRCVAWLRICQHVVYRVYILVTGALRGKTLSEEAGRDFRVWRVIEVIVLNLSYKDRVSQVASLGFTERAAFLVRDLFECGSF